MKKLRQEDNVVDVLATIIFYFQKIINLFISLFTDLPFGNDADAEDATV